jgi:hypothetical protein
MARMRAVGIISSNDRPSRCKRGSDSLRAIATFVVLLIVMQFFLEQLDVLALTVALNAAAFALVLIGVVFLVKNQKALA